MPIQRLTQGRRPHMTQIGHRWVQCGTLGNSFPADLGGRRVPALLGEPLLLDLAAGRIVLWHEADPRRQVPAVLEQLGIGDAGSECTGDHRADRGDRLEPWTQLARLVRLAPRGIERGDLSTEHLGP